MLLNSEIEDLLKDLVLELKDFTVLQFNPLIEKDRELLDGYTLSAPEINNFTLMINRFRYRSVDELNEIEYHMMRVNDELHNKYDYQNLWVDVEDFYTKYPSANFVNCFVLELFIEFDISNIYQYYVAENSIVYETKIHLLKEKIKKEVSNQFIEFSGRSDHNVHLSYSFELDDFRNSTRTISILKVSVKSFIFLPNEKSISVEV